MSAISLPPAAQQFIDATNAESRSALLAAFSETEIVDDFGREFLGREGIGQWSDRENIGTHNRISVERTVATPPGHHAEVTVSGDGYNGSGTFLFELDSAGPIERLTIRG